MKIPYIQVTRTILLGAAILTLSSTAAIADTSTAASTAPRMKMTTDIPDSIIMPNKIETRIGTLELFDGLPDDETVEKARQGMVCLFSPVRP